MNTKTKQNGRLAHPLAIAVALAAGGVSAQDNRLEEVLVTAQKREQSLIDVPISLKVYTDRDLELIRATELRDYLDLTPNVAVQARGDRFSQFFTIRGTQNFGGRANALGVYVDEFNVAPSSTIRGYNQNLVDVERIEVLRGPQGTTFGRNVLGGALNIVTKKATTDAIYGSVTADSGVMSDDELMYLFRGSINLPLSDTLALRLSSVYEYEEGWVENVNPESTADSNKFDGYGIRVAARWTPKHDFTGDFVLSYEDAAARTGSAVPTGIIRPGSFVDQLPFLFTTPIPFDPFGVGFYPDNEEQNFFLGDQRRLMETVMANARFEWNLGAVTLISVTGYIDLQSENGVDNLDLETGNIPGDTTGYNFIWAKNPQDDLESFSQELRAEWQLREDLFLLAGALYAEDEENQSEFFGTGPDVLLPIFPTNFILGANLTVTETEQLAGFGELAWQATDRLELIAGGRYTRDEVEQASIGVVTGNSIDDSETFTEFSGRLSAVLQLTDSINTYATFSQGFKSGGFGLATGTSYDSETVDNYELGIKGDFLDDRLRASASVFFMDWQDVQVNVSDLDPNSPTFLQVFTQNAADAELYGFEAELTARPAEGFTVQLGIGYLETEFKGQDCSSPAFVESGQECLNGTELPRQAPWTINWSAQYDWTVGDGYDVYARVCGNYRDDTVDFAGALPVQEALSSDSYDLWHAQVGVSRGPYSGMLYVQNITDDRPIVGSRDPGGINPQGIIVQTAEPRSIGVRFTYDFGAGR